MLRANLDGIPLDLAARLLPGRTRFNLGLGPHIHAHARAQRQYADRPDAAAASTVRMSPLKQAALLDSLRRTIDGLHWEPTGTEWADYADHTSYSDDAAQAKDDLVRGMLESAGGSVVWDLGANTGRFSRIAASLGRRVVAWDIDPAADGVHYRTVRREGRPRSCRSSATSPSRARRWAGSSPNGDRCSTGPTRTSSSPWRSSTTWRSDGTCHSTAIAELFARLGPNLIVEFVPREDAMVKRLLATREDVFADYTRGLGSAPRSSAGSTSRTTARDRGNEPDAVPDAAASVMRLPPLYPVAIAVGYVAGRLRRRGRPRRPTSSVRCSIAPPSRWSSRCSPRCCSATATSARWSRPW